MNNDIEKLARKSVQIIKENWGLPDKGVLAGGSLSNIMWELISGNKAVVNDIDIFIESDFLTGKEIHSIKYSEQIAQESYSGISFYSKTKGYYKIIDSIKRGIFNTIKYYSDKKDWKLVIEAFDINCTRISYCIEKDEFYWTKDFEDFINTGKLKITKLNTPAHTAIRLSKKSKDLDIKVDDYEYIICRDCIDILKYNNFTNISRTRFKDKYKNNYIDNEIELNKFFKLEIDNKFTKYVNEKYKSSDTIYKLNTNSENPPDKLYYFNSVDSFLFYMRNIKGNHKLEKIHSMLQNFYTSEDYIDIENISDSDLELLCNLTKFSGYIFNNLKGYKISEQIKFVKKIFNNFRKDLAFSILERTKLNNDIELTEDNKLLLELSVRKTTKSSYNKFNNFNYVHKW